MNKLRTILLTVLILALVAGGLPVTESLAKWSMRSSVSRHKKYRRHSRAWWRRYRARMRVKRERAALRRIQRQEVSRLNQPSTAAVNSAAVNSSPVSSTGGRAIIPAALKASQTPYNLAVPQTWSAGSASASGVVKFVVNTPDGRPAGTAVLAPIAVQLTDPDAAQTARSKTVGGASLSTLRRIVIDQMVAEGGWVVNDMVREMHGRRVFVVLAQTGQPGAPKHSLTFYFTEVDGRIYRLATNTPIELAEPVAAGSEQIMASLRSQRSEAMAEQK
jgi:hypothetical protein